MRDPVAAVIEALVERLCDLENGDPYYYLIAKEQLEGLCLRCELDPDLTLEQVREMLEHD